MANKDIKNEQSTPTEKKPKKKPHFFRRFLLLLAVLIVVLTVSVLSTMEDGDHFTALRRYLMYGNSAQTQDLYTYASHQSNLYERLSNELLVVNPQGIQILHQDGTLLYEMQTVIGAPAISVGTELAAVCDTQGSSVHVLSSTGLRWTHNSGEGLLCYCARMSSSDHLAVTEQKNGYKASVSVYDQKGTLIFRFDSHDSYLSDAVVTPDGKRLVVLALGEKGGAFTSTVVVYDLVTAQRIGEYPISDALVLDLSVTDERIILLCDKRLVILTLDGQTMLNYTYGERYLHDYALTGEDFCALLLGRYQSSNICRLATYSLDGETLASLELTEEVLDMSAAGDRLAVLYTDALVIYDRTLNEVARLDETDHAGGVRMDHDGTALLIAETAAWRFLP
ncbi:MAG: hypothetical protein IKM11_02280 [Oscillospiraceae bacterium]|nr:hypothetical protein [Oscillospiraceae bacterium]